MANSVSNLRSESLDLLRFPLALVIVAIHVLDFRGFFINGEPIDISDYKFLNFLYIVKAAMLKDQSVPIYFFISGYVFFLGGEMSLQRFFKKFKNRIKSLLIPYISWNYLALSFMILAMLFSNNILHNNKPEGLCLDFSAEAILNTLWNANDGVIKRHGYAVLPQDFAMWFVRDLLLVILTTPILYVLVKRIGIYVIFVLGFLWGWCWFFESMFLKQLSAGFFFFTMGSFFSITNYDMVVTFKKIRTISFIVFPSICLFMLWSLNYFIEAYPYLKLVNIVLGVFFAFNVTIYIIEKRKIRAVPFLAAASFYIYAGHPLFFPPLQRIVFNIVHPDSELMILFSVAAIYTTTIIFLLVAFYLFNKSSLLTKMFIGRHYENRRIVTPYCVNKI